MELENRVDDLRPSIFLLRLLRCVVVHLPWLNWTITILVSNEEGRLSLRRPTDNSWQVTLIVNGKPISSGLSRWSGPIQNYPALTSNIFIPSDWRTFWKRIQEKSFFLFRLKRIFEQDFGVTVRTVLARKWPNRPLKAEYTFNYLKVVTWCHLTVKLALRSLGI